MNPLQIINLALRIAGVLGQGQSAMQADVHDCFTLLNTMISVWNRRRWLIYHLVDVAYTATGAQSYTVGPGQNFNVARPDEIMSGYARQLYSAGATTVDFPLSIIDSREDYGDIALKSLVSFPTFLFYDAAYPVGNLYVYPLATSNYEIHILVKDTLSQFTSLQATVNLPPEYQEALIWNLAARLRPVYALPVDPTIHAIAMQALQVIRGANTQIPAMKMPAGIGRNGGWPAHGVPGIIEGTFTLDESLLG